MDTGKLLVDLVEFKAVTFNKLSLSWRGVAILLIQLICLSVIRLMKLNANYC